MVGESPAEIPECCQAFSTDPFEFHTLETSAKSRLHLLYRVEAPRQADKNDKMGVVSDTWIPGDVWESIRDVLEVLAPSICPSAKLVRTTSYNSSNASYNPKPNGF